MNKANTSRLMIGGTMRVIHTMPDGEEIPRREWKRRRFANRKARLKLQRRETKSKLKLAGK